MAITGLIKKLIANHADEKRFKLVIDRDGLNFVLPKNEFDQCEKCVGSTWLLHQYVCLQMLEEQGVARRFANGFTVASEDAVLLESDVHSLMELPPQYSGRFETRVEGQTGQSAFSVKAYSCAAGWRQGPPL